MVAALLIILVAYLIGSIPVGYLWGRALRGIDLRQYGSGNVGASNVYQAVARWAVVPVGLAQIGLAMAAIGLAKALDQELTVQVLAGLAAMLGAVWSVYLAFSGGRGIAASIGFMLMFTPITLAVFTVVSLLGVAARSIPLAVGLGIALAPLSALIVDGPGAIAAGCLGMAGIVFTKRLVANRGASPETREWREVLLNRLLFDRDVRDRDQWIRRGLGEDQSSR
jgi:glycerol-3-phosphate acyltransferase PlsY